MPAMNKIENVTEQYSDDKNLSIRTSLHNKYSTNKKGLVPWLFEQYKFFKNCKILELGCGYGWHWDGRIETLPNNSTLVMSDFSDGMVSKVREKFSKYHNIDFKQIDIQNIPYDNNTYDAVIANHMLYHVPELNKALSEVSRILKNGGKFYSTTNGNGGMRAFLRNAFRQINPNAAYFTQDYSFSLENGKALLKEHFSEVQQLDYEDSLAITQTKDLIDWMKSTISIASYSEQEIDALYDYFETIRKKEGAIHILKECGLFISTK